MTATAKTHGITSLYAAAAIRAAGGRYIGAEPIGAGRVNFLFADPDEQIAQLERRYYRHDLPPVQPAEYVTQFMRLRDDLRTVRGR